MPYDAGVPLEETCGWIEELMPEAERFVPPDRGQAIVRKWLSGLDKDGLSNAAISAAVEDAVALTADLLLSQPSTSGATAFDRLARNRAGAAGAEAAAIAALRKARFRLLRLDRGPPAGETLVRDVMSDEVFHIVGPLLPPLEPDTMLFGRVAVLGDGICAFAGAITPLDAPALAVARGHAAAGGGSASAAVRWAEAVYCHVVRHDTLEVPGLNRPGDDFDDDLAPIDDAHMPLLELVTAWATLEGPPDQALVQRTRAMANLANILDACGVCVLMRDAGQAVLADTLEQLLLVVLETVVRRERGGSGTLTLDAIRQGLDDGVVGGSLPNGVGALFASLRQRLVGSSTRRADEPALERLVQRIQGLRAKTVEQGCTEQEALAAAEKVAELLDRYGLSLGELDFRAQPCEGIGIQTDRRRMGPIDNCVPSIATFFDCRVWQEHAKGQTLRYVFFGLRGDVSAAQYLYEMVERAFETETAAFRAGTVYADMAGDRRKATNSFQLGLASGICSKLQTMREARETTRRSASGRDLVPVKAAMLDEEMDKLGLNLRQRSSKRSATVLSDAFEAGQEAGERIEFAAAITEAA